MSKSAFITGARGFVGRALTEWLEGRGWRVTPSAWPAEAGVLECDVRDEASIGAALKAAGKITHVFHLAAVAFVPDAARAPLQAMDINLQGTIRLAHVMQQLCPEARLVFIGSAEAYGPPRFLPVDESHPLNPQNAYAVSKAAADQYLESLSRDGVLNIVRVRPFNHSGPGQSTAFVLPSFAEQVARAAAGAADPVIRVGNLDAARDFLHVRDVVRAYERIARDGEAGQVYNVCSGQARTIQSALDLLLGMAGAGIRVERDPARMRPSDVPSIQGSHEALTQRTGWQPEISFENLMEELYAFHRDAVRTTL